MAVPTGYTGATAVAMVRSLTNQPTTPVDAMVYTFLNASLERVADELEPVLATSNIPLTAGAGSVSLGADVQDFERLTYSVGLPSVQGSLEYPLQELGPGEYADETGFAPAVVSGGMVLAFRRLTDASGVISLQLYPASPAAGFLNVYYYKRPLLWDQMNPNNGTDLDSAFQYAVILGACAMLQPAKGNTRQGGYFENLFRTELDRKIRTSGRRKRVHGSMVRDASSLGVAAPYWFP